MTYVAQSYCQGNVLFDIIALWLWQYLDIALWYSNNRLLAQW